MDPDRAKSGSVDACKLHIGPASPLNPDRDGLGGVFCGNVGGYFESASRSQFECPFENVEAVARRAAPQILGALNSDSRRGSNIAARRFEHPKLVNDLLN